MSEETCCYCWKLEDKEAYDLEGPFASIEECKSHILDYMGRDCEEKVAICRVHFIDPGEWADFDIEGILERMEDDLSWHHDFGEAVFFIAEKNKESAQEELTKLLREWAKKYIETNNEWAIGETLQVIAAKEL